jgi:hypothetical protein
MDAVALRTPTQRLHWLFGPVPSWLPAAAGDGVVAVPWEDDVAEIVTAYVNMHAVQPLPPHRNAIMHGKNAGPRLPPWALDMQAALRAKPLLARAVLLVNGDDTLLSFAAAAVMP